ncbi:MAG: phage portal protein [Aeromicrobium sp.]|uniref:phage portal protein n=1 Tax=Aeromicrobium sp. TaxID=1871063 RepID=UPI0039E576BB
MGLPTRDTAWPPPVLAPLLTDISTWAAWYSGQPDELAAAYRTATGGREPVTRPSQHADGVVGRFARWFWGQPTPAGQQRTKLHVPLAADLATGSADLLFSEPPQITTDTDEQEKRKRLDRILEGAGWESLLPEAAETAAALTGVYLRIVWDNSIADHPLITVVQPDSALPEFAFGQLRAVTFWQVVDRQGQTVTRHLERHEPGRILHGLYEGTPDRLGRTVPLAEHPSTAGLSVDADQAIATGATGLTAVYIPNVRPQRRSKWRNHPLGTHMGRSDLDGIEPALDALDEVYTSWMRDVRLGKARIIADADALTTRGRGQGADLDLDREVFVGINGMSDGGDGSPITAQQFAIRAADHEATITGLLRRIVPGAGYSPQTFGVDTDGAVATATEITARERKTTTTREKKTRYWTPQLRRLLATLCEVDAHHFGGPGPMDALTLDFGPAGEPTPLELATTAQALKGAQAASTETLVRLVHPDWTPDQVAEEAAAILAESSIDVPALGVLPGQE